MPILTAVYDVLVKKITFDKVIKKLLARPLVDE
jgi:glycerol-3-phosphate dehydrogenase